MESCEAINEAVEIEAVLAGLRRMEICTDHPVRDSIIESDHKNIADARAGQAAALRKVKAAFPMMVCCDDFETGGCKHGKACECGWLQAPWPWIVYQPGGRFCDCHWETRRAWMQHGGMRFWGADSVAQTSKPNGHSWEQEGMWPSEGPHRGDGSQE